MVNEQSLIPSPNISIYEQEAKKTPLLTQEELLNLITSYKNGDEMAKQKILLANYRLVLKEANKFAKRNTHLKLDDFIQEGNIALMKAIENYDPTKGAFSTYAIPKIRGHLLKILKEQEFTIRRPLNLTDDIIRYKKLLSNYEMQNIPLPSDTEICNILSISKKTLDKIRETLTSSVTSLNAMVKEDTEIGDLIPSEDPFSLESQLYLDRDVLIILKESLTSLEYYIAYYTLLSPNKKNPLEIANTLGIQRQRLSFLLKKIKIKMSTILDSKTIYKEDVLNNIMLKENTMYKRIKTNPITLSLIIKYQYLKDHLTSLENKLFNLIYFNKYTYTKDQLATDLNISIEECLKVIKSLRNKIKERFSDTDKYRKYRNYLLKKYKSKIFSLISSDSKEIDYKKIKENYDHLILPDILTYFEEVNYPLTKDEYHLLERYFNTQKDYPVRKEEIEREVNISLNHCHHKKSRLSNEILYNTYLKNKDNFSKEEQFYLECFIFHTKSQNIFKTIYPNSNLTKKGNYKMAEYIINKLERMHYNIYGYYEKNLTKEEYIKVRTKYQDRFTDIKLKILDLYYGIDGKKYSLNEIVNLLNKDYTSIRYLLANARNLAMSLYYGLSNRLDINKDLYIPYILDKKYSFIDSTRNILELYLIDNLSSEEIHLKVNLSTERVSQIIRDAIRKIDYYRFGLIKPYDIDKSTLETILKYYNFSSIEENILRLKLLAYKDNDEISKLLGIPLKNISETITKFNRRYYGYQIKDVILDTTDYIKEINLHPSESVLTISEKKFLSYYYGLKTKYNIRGTKLSNEELLKNFNLNNERIISKKLSSILDKIKGHKINIYNNELSYISRKELDRVLNDTHLPINSNEKELLCYLYGLKGYPYKSFNELESILLHKKDYLVNMYKRSILSIKKYQVKEIDCKIDYEEDIIPILRYFPLIDRLKLESLYKDNLTNKDISLKYNISLNQADIEMKRLRQSVKELLSGKKDKVFDFDYYLKVIDNPLLPFYGNLELAKESFNMFYGMNGKEKMTLSEIITKLNLGIAESALNSLIQNLMLAVCRYKSGIKKSNPFSFEQILDIYNRKGFTMKPYIKKVYNRYINKVLNSKNINSANEDIPYIILNDLLIENNYYTFNLDNTSKEEVLNILRRFGNEMNFNIKRQLMQIFDISEKEFMNGRDLNHVYRLLDKLNAKRKKMDLEVLSLKTA